MFHYVYRITNTKLNKHYYGCRTSVCLPSEDLGIKYFSSSTDKSFINDQKENINNYKYKVIRIFKKRCEAEYFETTLHKKFEVQINEMFYNKAQNTLMGFSVLGRKQTKEHINKRFKNIKGKTYEEKYGKEIASQKIEKLKKPKSEEHKRKLSESRTGYKATDEARENISLGLKKRYEDEDYCNKFRETMTEVNKRKDKREKASKKIKERWKDPEYLEKMKRRRGNIKYYMAIIQNEKRYFETLSSICDYLGLSAHKVRNIIKENTYIFNITKEEYENKENWKTKSNFNK